MQHNDNINKELDNRTQTAILPSYANLNDRTQTAVLLPSFDDLDKRTQTVMLPNFAHLELDDKHRLVSCDDLSKHNISIDRCKMLGAGGQATVFTATYNGKLAAIKETSVIDNERYFNCFLREKNDSKEYIIEYYGYYYSSNDYPYKNNFFHGLLFELAPYGSLDKLIFNTNKFLSLQERYHLSYQATKAVNYLHQLNIVHGDIKPYNFLIVQNNNDQYIIKIGDFGSAQFADQKRIANGTTYYDAPEILQNKYAQATKQSDIYSLGLTFFEIIARQKAARHEDVKCNNKNLLTEADLIQYRMTDKQIPKLPTDCLDSFKLKVYEKCMFFNPALRATASMINIELYNIIKNSVSI